MYTSKPKNLLELTKADIEKWLNTFDTVLTDCDGVLWNEGVAIEGVPEAIALLKSHGKEVYFNTNNGIRTRHDIWKLATALGYDIHENNIISPNPAIAQYLRMRNFQQKVYIIGSEAIRTELSETGIESFGPGPDVRKEELKDFITRQAITQHNDNVGAVIVGFDEYFNFDKMLKACFYIGTNTNCLFMCTNGDPVHRYPQFRIPGTGALLCALETCTGRKALQFGKPNPEICADLVKMGKVVPKRTLMIGDVCKVDILFGHNCGFQTLLVGSGHNSVYELHEVMQHPIENESYIPDFFIPSLGDIRKLI